MPEIGKQINPKAYQKWKKEQPSALWLSIYLLPWNNTHPNLLNNQKPVPFKALDNYIYVQL